MKALQMVATVLAVACSGVDPASPGEALQIALSPVGVGEYEVAPRGQLEVPLAVRAWNARGAVSGVEVQWEVVAGTGQFLRYPDALPDHASSRTDRDGIARTFFRISSPGPATINAEIPGIPGAASFLVTPIDQVVIEFGASINCLPVASPVGPSSFDAPRGTVHVGVTVKWTYVDDWFPLCRARIVSTKVPPGGKPFDTGFMAPGQSAKALLNVAGDWEYEDVNNGGGGVLRVR